MKFLKILLCLILAVALATLAINVYMLVSTAPQIKTVEELDGDYEYVLVLGAGYINDETPSPMLEDRIITGIKIYRNVGGDLKLLMSGDSEDPDIHDETGVMSFYAQKMGLTEEEILKDPYGLSTYDSLWRLKNVYGASKVVIVTQRFHIYRSVYIANHLGLEAAGVCSDIQNYVWAAMYYDMREILARNKAFINCILKPAAAYDR